MNIGTIDKQKCTGCCACMNACEQQCITMIHDSEGFIYPKVDVTKCKKCSTCVMVCPILRKKSIAIKRLSQPKIFAAWHADHAIRLDSTSGGVFSALAQNMFNNDGYVSGAIYAEDHSVYHILLCRI